jgi:O-antigen/teichoic acid export membrane protein
LSSSESTLEPTEEHRPESLERAGSGRNGPDFRPERRAIYGLTGVEGVARLLSFGFYLVAARVLSVSGFGVVRYTISLGLLALAPLLVLATALNRELGAARGDAVETERVLGTSVLIAFWIWVASAGLCLAASAGGLLGSADLTGLLVVLATGTVFNLYYQLSRGLGQIGRIAITYVGGSALQLVLVLVMAAAGTLTPLAALVLFGVGSALPVIVCEVAAPVVRRRRIALNREMARILWRLAAPLALAQLGYMIWISADQIWVDSTLGSASIGLYGAAKTVVQAFMVLTAGSVGVMLPRVAQLRSRGEDEVARHFIFAMTVRLVAIAAVVAAIVIALRTPLLTAIFGSGYDAASGSLTALSVSMTAYIGFVAVTGSAIGWGRPGLSALGVCVAAVSEIALLLLWNGGGIVFAGWANAISMGLALLAVGLALLRRPLR